MKRLHFDYFMQINYSEIVTKCHFTIKCLPGDTLRQKVENLSAALTPPVIYSRGRDSFGNEQLYGADYIPHETFTFRIQGNVRTRSANGEAEADEDSPMIFRCPHGLNLAGEALRTYHASLHSDSSAGDYEKGMFLMHSLHRDFAYEKGCTTVATTAEEAWRLGRGVCQDYAHILIALLQMEKIPARYVTGMMVGEGASHAWVEILHQGRWYGLDPTNDTCVGEDYIRIGCGRDAGDCQINRGIMHGGGSQNQVVQVSVTEIDLQ